MLFSLWAELSHRPTRDLDLLGFGEPSIDGLAAIFQNLCSLTVEPDGMTFDSDSVHVSEIREGQTYLGLRLKLVARLGTARTPVQVDIGFGDTVIPEATDIDYPLCWNHRRHGFVPTHRWLLVAAPDQCCVSKTALNLSWGYSLLRSPALTGSPRRFVLAMTTAVFASAAKQSSKTYY